MKKLKKRVVLSTSAGLASLVISAAGCAYGPAPDVSEQEISSLKESINEDTSSVGETSEEADETGNGIDEPTMAIPSVYGPPPN